MNLLTPAQTRAFTPACPTPAPWRHWVAFLAVTAAALALLARGVPGASLAGVLLAMAVLTTVLTGHAPTGAATRLSRAADNIRALAGLRRSRGTVTA